MVSNVFPLGRAVESLIDVPIEAKGALSDLRAELEVVKAIF